MKIAWFTPYSPWSAIGRYSATIVNELGAQGHAVTLFASDITSPDEAISAEIELCMLQGADLHALVPTLDHFDAVVYNLGDHHGWHRLCYDMSLLRPGVVILHDLTMLHDNMAKSALTGSYGTVVHSEFAREAVNAFAAAPVEYLALPRPDDIAASDELFAGDHAGRIRVMTFGMLNPNKLIDETIRAIGSSSMLRESISYQVVGEYAHDQAYSSEMKRLVQELNLEANVEFLGYRDDAALRRYLTDADIVVNLRNPHSGEASWSVLESTLAGKPTLVWKHGWYDEWPERTVVKVASRGDLVLALERLCREPELRESIGRTAAEYARATFVTARYCERLLAFNDRVRYAAPALRLSEFVSGTLRELGVLASDGNMLARMTDEVAGVSGL